MRYFRITKRNEQTGETRADIIGATHVPGLATYEVNQGWSIVSPIEELDGPPPLSDDAVEELKGVFADHLKRKHVNEAFLDLVAADRRAGDRARQHACERRRARAWRTADYD